MRTLDRLAALRPRPPVIVVDNASTDRTVPVVQQRHPEVAVIAADRNLGAAARNLGVARARTPYVAFSDDDSWWAQAALPHAESLLQSCDRLGLIAAHTLVGAEQRPDPATRLMAESPLGRSAGLPGPLVLGFLACSAIVRRAAFQAAGGFSRLLFFGGEERLLAWDLAAGGWALCYVPDVVAHHVPSPRRPPGRQRRHLEQRNALLAAWMRRPPRVALTATASAVLAGLRDTERRGALTAAINRLPAALRQRRRLPPDVEHQVALLEREHER